MVHLCNEVCLPLKALRAQQQAEERARSLSVEVADLKVRTAALEAALALAAEPCSDRAPP